eukprot:TRINITY_DN4732_c0_g1_i3.p1 TRINITY_DN4732_c0_g1~~TRINITY_DN4732_c0_g1_i3.p1  ORF type:complete len:368 (+),score=98.62 TRINITY_DN4732_c0_g1_i3:481-1584(+)
MRLGQDHRSILKQSLSNMKQAWQDSEKPQSKPLLIPRPKIVCPVLYQNTIAARSHAALQPRIVLTADTVPSVGPGEEVKSEPSKPDKGLVRGKRAGLDSLLERLQNLDSRNIERIERLLNELEKSDKGEKINIIKKPPAKKHLTLRILSTWGHPHVAGLTEIELYDSRGRCVAAPLNARNLGDGPSQDTARLTNGQVLVSDEEAMWVAYLPPPPKALELVFALSGDCEVGGLVVWNYNKNSNDSVKGVRNAEVVLNGKVVWTGVIKRGNGRVNEDYSTEIPLCKNEDVFKGRDYKFKQAHGGESSAESKEDIVMLQGAKGLKPVLADRFTKIPSRKKFTAKLNEPKLPINIKPVSYTHLTLPTICSV